MTSTTCNNLGFHSQVHCYVFTCLGAVLSLSCLSLIGVTCHLSRKVKLLKRTKEESYKRSKTCTHYRLSMRELQEREDAWDEENGFTDFEPMTTIGSAFYTQHHGPTPTSPPPPTKEVTRTDYENVETDRCPKDRGQTSNSAEPHVKMKVPLKPPHSKSLPSLLGRSCPEDFDKLNNTGSLYPTLDCRLDQTDRQDPSGLTDAWYKHPDGWHRHPDDNNPYYVGKLSGLQSLRSEVDIIGNNMLNVNTISKNANAIEVIHETTLIENMYDHSASAKEEDNIGEYLKSIVRQSLGSYIDMKASQTLPDGEEYVQMKIKLTRSAASEICRKARLRGMSSTSDVLYENVMEKPTKSGVDSGLAGEDYDDINACCPVSIEITD